MMKIGTSSRRVIAGALAAALLYVGSYSILSMQGTYVMYVGAGADGSADWFPLWCQNMTPSPTTGRLDTEYPNMLGFFYLPLLIADRSFVHPHQKDYWQQLTPDQQLHHVR